MNYKTPEGPRGRRVRTLPGGFREGVAVAALALLGACQAPAEAGTVTLEDVTIPAAFRFEAQRALTISPSPALLEAAAGMAGARLRVRSESGAILYSGLPRRLESGLEVVLASGEPGVDIVLERGNQRRVFAARRGADGWLEVGSEEEAP